MKSYIDNQNIPGTMYTDKHGHKLEPQPLILFWKSQIVMLKHVKWEVSDCHRTGNMFLFSSSNYLNKVSLDCIAYLVRKYQQ